MTGERATAPLIGGVELLERAIGYTLGNLPLVTRVAMSRPTPCRDWDLRALLKHIDDSEAAGDWTVDADPVAGLRDRAHRLLDAWTRADGHKVISIAGCPLPVSILTSTGALEVAVHGWDVARACRQHRPIPPLLARDLLELAPLLVTGVDRPARFAAPVQVSPLASPSEQLIAHLGRDPS